MKKVVFSAYQLFCDTLNSALPACEISSIDSNVVDNEISIDGYSIVKKDRNRHGGRVLLYVRDGIDYSEITELASEQVDSVWIKLMYKKETLMLSVVYRHHPQIMITLIVY